MGCLPLTRLSPARTKKELSPNVLSDAALAARRRNLKKCGPLTQAGRQRLREAALRHQPWEHATGPRTEEGKRRSRLNARRGRNHDARARALRAWYWALEYLVWDEVLPGRQGLVDKLTAMPVFRLPWAIRIPNDDHESAIALFREIRAIRRAAREWVDTIVDDEPGQTNSPE